MTALQAFAATLAGCVLVDRSLMFAWRRITRPLPRITHHEEHAP